MQDTRFSIAIHLLVLLSEVDAPMSSVNMAQSVGTNPSFVRKILSSLKRAGLLKSHRGRAGFSLVQPAADITLLQIYQAIYNTNDVEIFAIHKNPSDKCLVGRYITPTLDDTFKGIRDATEQKMAETTLADCIADMRKMAKRDGVL